MGSIRHVLALAFVSAWLILSTPIVWGAESCVQMYGRVISHEPARILRFQKMQAGDLTAWRQWLNGALKDGSGLSEIYAVSAAAPSLSQKNSTALVTDIARSYAKLDKRGDASLGPRRVADAVMNAIFRPERYFEEARQRNLSPEGALRAYFHQVHQGLSGAGINPLLDVDDLKMIAKEFRNSLREEKENQSSVLLFGSVINGRGQVGKSDLDFISSIISHRIQKSTIEGQVNRRLRERYGKGLSEFSTMPEDLSDPARMGVVNPIQLKISADSVEIVVYPRHQTNDPAKTLPPQVFFWF